MQIKSLRTRSYRSWKINDRPVGKIARERLKKLKLFECLRSEGCSEKIALEAVETSRATLYRWRRSYQQQGAMGLEPKSTAPLKRRNPMWSPELECVVRRYRKRHPLWGKKTLTALIKREEGLEVSESTVGRILTKLVKRKIVDPVCFYYGAIRPRKERIFNKHAKRWQKNMKATNPGQMVQIDHMSVAMQTGLTVKHFEAICPVSKITVSEVYHGASSRTAAQFLEVVLKKIPFKVTSIQVDGGSEFMKDFEQACQDRGIALYVLPPRSPELNGCVERCNKTLRYEFYRLYDGIIQIDEIRNALKGYMNIYNTYRPHQALNMLTPMAYYQSRLMGS